MNKTKAELIQKYLEICDPAEMVEMSCSWLEDNLTKAELKEKIKEVKQ